MDRPLLFFLTIVALAALAIPLSHERLWDKEILMRPALVAGQFYTDDAAQLRLQMRSLLDRKPTLEPKTPIFALVAPHAGYAYSGTVAAQAFAELKGRSYKRVVVIGPSHVVGFGFASIYSGDSYQTPLGTIPIDKAFAETLAAKNDLLRLSNDGHGSARGRGEHSVEIEIPFLQSILGDFKLVPIVMGDQNYAIDRALGVALANTIKIDPETGEPDTLIIASSDLSHFHTGAEASAMDHQLLNAIVDGDYYSLSSNLAQGIWEACGGGPIVAVLIAAERLGANTNRLLAYAHSGDVTGDQSRVVGYSAIALIHQENAMETAPTFSLSAEDQIRLLEIAKKTVTAVVNRKEIPPLPTLSNALLTARGAFVTLKKNGELRGCIGYMTPSKPLAETVREMAVSAAMKDRRFSPVKPDELGELSYEISVLSPMHRVADVNAITIGQDGLLLIKGNGGGVFLPQVPIEQKWDRETYLQQLAVKAGLPQKSWLSPDADLFKFSAIVFGGGIIAKPFPSLPRKRESSVAYPRDM